MDLSIVVPVYNEEENLPYLYQAIMKAMENVKGRWEVILVDDGSRDGSLGVLENSLLMIRNMSVWSVCDATLGKRQRSPLELIIHPARSLF